MKTKLNLARIPAEMLQPIQKARALMAVSLFLAASPLFALNEDFDIPNNTARIVRSATYVSAFSTDQGTNSRLDERAGVFSLFDAISATGSNGNGQTSFNPGTGQQPWRMSLSAGAEGNAGTLLPGDVILDTSAGRGQAASSARHTLTVRSDVLADGTEVDVQVSFLATALIGLSGSSDSPLGRAVGESRATVTAECSVEQDVVAGVSTKRTFFQSDHVMRMTGRTDSPNLLGGLADRTNNVGFRDDNDLSQSRVVGSFTSKWIPNSPGNVIVGDSSASMGGQVKVTADFVVTLKVGETVEIFLELGLATGANGLTYSPLAGEGSEDYTTNAQSNASFSNAGTLDFSSSENVTFEINGVAALQDFDILGYSYDPATSMHQLTIDVLDGVTYESEYSFNLKDWFPLQPLFFGGLGVQQTSVFAPVSEDGRVFLKVIGNR